MIEAGLFEAIEEAIRFLLTCAEVVGAMVALISIVWFLKYLIKSSIQVSKWWHKEEKKDLGEE